MLSIYALHARASERSSDTPCLIFHWKNNNNCKWRFENLWSEVQFHCHNHRLKFLEKCIMYKRYFYLWIGLFDIVVIIAPFVFLNFPLGLIYSHVAKRHKDGFVFSVNFQTLNGVILGSCLATLKVPFFKRFFFWIFKTFSAKQQNLKTFSHTPIKLNLKSQWNSISY